MKNEYLLTVCGEATKSSKKTYMTHFLEYFSLLQIQTALHLSVIALKICSSSQNDFLLLKKYLLVREVLTD
jgi:hypothetical protein